MHNLSGDELLKALENHVTKVMTHFGDNCYAWDVVNEALNEDGSYRNSFWYQKTGTKFIETAFKTASAVKKSLGLKTKLYYNDYNTERIGAKSNGAIKLVQNLRNKGIEINGVGFQDHFTLGYTPSTADQVKNLQRFTAMGLDVAITELDIKSTSSPTKQQQQQQATEYKNTMAACKQVSKCVGVTIWDFDDTYSWLGNTSPLPWYQPKGRNTPLVRKAAYDGIISGWTA